MDGVEHQGLQELRLVGTGIAHPLAHVMPADSYY
jgi:hypothetical protein